MLLGSLVRTHWGLQIMHDMAMPLGVVDRNLLVRLDGKRRLSELQRTVHPLAHAVAARFLLDGLVRFSAANPAENQAHGPEVQAVLKKAFADTSQPELTRGKLYLLGVVDEMFGIASSPTSAVIAASARVIDLRMALKSLGKQLDGLVPADKLRSIVLDFRAEVAV